MLTQSDAHTGNVIVLTFALYQRDLRLSMENNIAIMCANVAFVCIALLLFVGPAPRLNHVEVISETKLSDMLQGQLHRDVQLVF